MTVIVEVEGTKYDVYGIKANNTFYPTSILVRGKEQIGIISDLLYCKICGEAAEKE